VLAKAPDQSLASFKRAVRRALLRAAPQRAEQRHVEAMTQRRVVRTPDADGMSGIWMLLPDTGAATFMTAIDPLARRYSADDARTADQRRADAAVQLAIDALTGTSCGELPREHGMRPSVQVTVALSTLLGLDEQPGDLDGSGPIPATLARRIAADQTGTWRRLVTDETGRLLDYGRSTYRPPKDLADHVIARDRTCRFPNCNRKAGRCELDHRQPWEQGGATNRANLDALCSRHHHAKHQAGWQPKRLPDGATEWRGPTGHKYVEEAATYPLDHMIQADPDPPPY
jgi:5-methylcytosine-specific restriction endonuclease McrA